MKSLKFIKWVVIPSIIIGSVLFLSYCKKEIETQTVYDTKTVTVTVHDTINRYLTTLVHDTIKGKSIIGNATYPDASGTAVAAHGAVIKLYLGSSVDPTKMVATAIADPGGDYKLPYLLPGSYFVYAAFNTENQNSLVMSGINFATNPGYPVTLGTADLTQNLTLVTIGATGTRKLTIVASDTIANPTRKYITVESHSAVTWSVEHLDDNSTGLTLGGGFPSPGFKLVSFFFDEANPANSYLKGYVLTSTCYSGNDGRDKERGGCVDAFFNHDTVKTILDPIYGKATILAQTDTAYYWANAGQIEKYGSGYIAHGTLAPVWKHQGGEIVPPKVTACAPDTVMGYNGQLGWNKRIEGPVDMYFEFQGGKKVYNATGTVFNWYFEFEGQFTFSRSAFYMKHGLGDKVTVNPHVQLKGVNNKEY